MMPAWIMSRPTIALKPFNYLRKPTMQIKTINSSSLEWEIFPNDGGVTYCADGDGFVTLEETINEFDGTPWWTLCEQGDPIGEFGTDEPKTLAEALEFAQNYMATEYSELFQDIRFD